MHMAVFPRLARLARVPPHAMETKKEQNMRLEKIRARKKKIKR
jgi:hypothetical protein